MKRRSTHLAAAACLFSAFGIAGCKDANSTIGSLNSAVNFYPVSDDFVLFAREGIGMLGHAQVTGGDIGAAEDWPGGFPTDRWMGYPSNYRIAIGPDSQLDPQQNVLGATVLIGNGASLGDVHANTLRTLVGSSVTFSRRSSGCRFFPTSRRSARASMI